MKHKEWGEGGLEYERQMSKDGDENVSIKKKESTLERKRDGNARNERWCGKEGI